MLMFVQRKVNKHSTLNFSYKAIGVKFVSSNPHLFSNFLIAEYTYVRFVYYPIYALTRPMSVSVCVSDNVNFPIDIVYIQNSTASSPFTDQLRR